MQLSLAFWCLASAILGIVVWNLLFRPRLDWAWAVVLFGLALAPHVESLRPGFIYGPLDTNHPNLPWAESVEAQRYRSRGGALNDVTLQFVPWQEEARRQLLAGRMPLLNPSSGCGQALLGNGQAAPFSLTSLLSLPLDAVRAQGLRSFLKLLLALAGAFLAARELRCRPVFCLLAAVAYGYGGSLAVWRLFPHAEVMALWPFAYLATEQLLADPSRLRPRILLFLSLAGMFLAGHPETAAMAGLALFGRWLFALRAGREHRLAVAWCAAIALGSLLATSFSTLPLLETVLLSEKLGQQGHGRDPSLGQAAEGAGWASFVNDVAPGIFGTPQRSSEHGPVPLHWLAEGSTGFVSLVLALLGASWWWPRPDSHARETYLSWLGMLCFALFFNLFGVPGRIFALPFVSAIDRRYAAYLGGFAVALLAASTLERWCSTEPGRGRRLAFAGGAGLAVLAALSARWIAASFWRRQLSLGAPPPDALAEANWHWLLALLAAMGLGACLLLRRQARLLGALLALLTVLQLWSGYARYTPTVESREAMPRLPVVELLKRAATPFRVAGTRGVLFPNSSTYYGVADIRTHDPTERAQYVDWLAEFLDLDRSTYKKQYRRPQPKHEPFLRLLGVRYLLSGSDLRLGPPWTDRGRFGLTRLWELPGAVRWAFFPGRLTFVPDARTARQQLHGEDVGQMATVEDPGMPVRSQPNGKARVLDVQERGDRLTLRVEVEANAWLLVSQAMIPGWRAWADGTPIPVATADGALLAAQVPAGTRVVHLRFLPASVVAGGMISGVAWIVAAAALCRGWRRRSRSPASRPLAWSEEP